MNRITNIVADFNDTLVRSELTSVTIDVVENLVDGGIFNDIPILGTLISVVQTTQNVSNYLFLRKIGAFISKIKDVSPAERSKAIKSIDESGKYREKVGLTLLSIIDKCESAEKAEYLAIWFRAFLKGDIEYECFMYGAHIIQKTFLDDLKAFIEDVEPWKMIEDSTEEIMSGLYRLDISLTLMSYKDAIEGQKSERELDYVAAVITDIGAVIREVFNCAIVQQLI